MRRDGVSAPEILDVDVFSCSGDLSLTNADNVKILTTETIVLSLEDETIPCNNCEVKFSSDNFVLSRTEGGTNIRVSLSADFDDDLPNLTASNGWKTTVDLDKYTVTFYLSVDF